MQPILLLHGAAGAMDQLACLEKDLTGPCMVYRINFSAMEGLRFQMNLFP